MRVAIKDVSRAAGVSIGTVSNVLNSPDLVAPHTLKRVSAVIADLGYRPNRSARALQKQRTFSIGYRIPSETDGFALDVFLHRMVERAGDAHLDVVLFAPRPGQSEVDAYQDMVRRGAVDGFVISGTFRNDQRIEYLLATRFPFVTFGRTDQSDRHPWVDIDGGAGLRQAVGHLSAIGHRDIALIGWPHGSLSGDERVAGYEQGLADQNIVLRPELIARSENTVTDGEAAMRRLLALDHAPTAVATVSDLIALGAMNAIREKGLRIGQDVAVVGFDDIPSAGNAVPPLSSIRQRMDTAGQMVIDMLHDRLEGQSTGKPRSEIVVPELIVRSSSQPIVSDSRQ